MKKLYCVFLVLFLVLFTSCTYNQIDDYKLSIVAPNGAPSVSLVDMRYNNDLFDFTLGVDPTVLQSHFVSNDTDFIIAPINLGTKMYQKNKNYKLAGVVTWGNLYFASQNEFTTLDMNNNNVIFFGENTINDGVVKYILNYKNITPNIEYLGSTALTQAKLISDDKIVLIAEPSLTQAKMTNSNIYSISVETLFKEITGIDGFPQAGLFVKSKIINEHKRIVDDFILKVEASALATKNDLENVSKKAEELGLGKANILANAIPRCSIRYVKASDSKNDILKFMEYEYINSFFGTIDEEFFY